MHTIFPIAVTSFLLSTALLAADDLDQLKASYEGAVARATAPLKATYEKELQKLLQHHAQAGKLDDAAKVMSELQSIGAASLPTGQTTPLPTNATTTSPQATERYFVNKVWKTPTGTIFSFEKAGMGKRVFGKDETSLVWRTTADGVIEATGESTKGGNMRTWYFRFVSSSEAYYGDSKDNLGSKLEKQ
jgi:hypothetical protein